MTNWESVSNYKAGQHFFKAVSMATIAPVNSALNEVVIPRLTAKQSEFLALLFLKTPPQTARPGQPLAVPLILHLTQWATGGPKW